jgi:hypothetical protein
MDRVFISHSSRDGAAARWVADWLRDQGYEPPFLDFDKHVGLRPGTDWERTLYREIETSQALLIVQSTNWMASKWCFAEFIQARSLGKPMFNCLAPTAMQPLPAANPWRRSRPTCSNSTCAKTAKPAWRPSPASSGNWPWTIRGASPWTPIAPPPYPGLLCFDQEDAALYFGRDGEICDLIARLHVLRIQGPQRL